MSRNIAKPAASAVELARKSRVDLLKLQAATQTQLDAILAQLDKACEQIKASGDPRCASLEEICCDVDAIRSAFVDAIEACSVAERMADSQLSLF